MAETAVYFVLDKLYNLLSNEVRLLMGVERELVESVEQELRMIKAFMKDADEKAEMEDTSSNTRKEWVNQLREIAYGMEDVMDEYLFKVARRSQRHGIVGVASRIGHSIKSLKPRHEIASEIENIRDTLNLLNQRKQTLGFVESTESIRSRSIDYEVGSHQVSRDARAHMMDHAPLVGVDQTKATLTAWLSGQHAGFTVIAVVGQGGLGKTTIVDNVYKRQKEERCFDSCAWITVSSLKVGKPLLETMMQSFYEYDGNPALKFTGKLDDDALTKKLKEYLQEKRYMIVFDDVRYKDFWICVNAALPIDKSSSIMITTRDKGVAESCTSYGVTVHIHELQPLPHDNALTLFYLTAQVEPHGHKELIELSEDFVRKCDGVPLAIMAIARLLSTKGENAIAWRRVHRSLCSHFKSFYQVLSESYNDLPYHLKLCLLYFGLFPQSYSISRVRLINLWIAEGFVEQIHNGNQTLEEVAEEYLDELIRRSLVKVSKVYPYENRVRRCRVHDLMHDFLLEKCHELNFCQVINVEGFKFHKWTRRLSILTNNHKAGNYGRVRSFLDFNLQDLPNSVMESLLSSFKFLIALDFENAPLDRLPEAVGNLLLLKYLNLRNTKIKTIPKFISKLCNLETLDLKHTLITQLPAYIKCLVKLRYLIAGSNSHGVKLEVGIGCLKALQKLTKVDTSGDEDGVVLKELGHLKHMRKLGIMKLRRRNGKLLCSAIESMKDLCSLRIRAATLEEVLDLDSLTNPLPYLQRLYLDGHLQKLPNWIPRLSNLTKLHLTWSGLKEDPLFALGNLPELLDLFLLQSYEGEQFHCRNGWFSKLKILRVRSMPRLKAFNIDKGALPLLEELQLVSCPEMETVPLDIENLTSLKFLYLEDMRPDFRDNMQEVCHEIFKHISSVTYFDDGHYIPINV